MVSQMLAILEMQWHSRINQIRRESWLGYIVTLLFAAMLATSAFFVLLIGVAGGYYLAKESSADYYLLAWNGINAFFVLAWIIYFSNDVFRSDAIPLQRLMHLPVSPWQAFAMNFFQTWINLPMLYFAMVALGLIAGSCFQDGPSILWQMTPVFLYVLMVTSITSLVQARIAVWLANPRTRRLVLVLVPAMVGLFSFGFAISTSTIRNRIPTPQVPNAPELTSLTPEVKSDRQSAQVAPPLETHSNESNSELSSQSPGRSEPSGRLLKSIKAMDIAIPPMWLAGCFFDHSVPSRVSWMLMSSMLAISIIALRANYALTLKYYQNGFDTAHANRKLERRLDIDALNAQEQTLLERKFPGLDETYSAIVSMSWLSLSRSPEIKLSILLPMMQPIIMMFLFGQRGGPQSPSWQFVAILALSALGLFLSSGFLCNLFGLDRAGFRFWVLSPIPRDTILHARNIAFGLPALFLSIAMGLGICLFWGTSLLVMIESLFGLLAFFPVYLLVSNIMSILAPFPLPPGGMHPKEFSWKTLALNLLLTSSLPFILAWCCLPIGFEALLQWYWPSLPNGPVAVFGLILIFWRSWTFYHYNLPFLGDLLQAREIDLLSTVTMHVEKK
jgi:ABC-2 type transport system permease protein